MTKRFLMLGLLMLAVIVTNQAFAETDSSAKPGAMSKVIAIIDSIDLDAKTIVLKMDEKSAGGPTTKTVTFTDTTKFDRKETAIDANGLKPGDHVKVEMDATGNLLRVSVVDKSEHK